jgi:hypothetical protein
MDERYVYIMTDAYTRLAIVSIEYTTMGVIRVSDGHKCSHLLATAVNKILFASAALRFTENRFSQRSDSCDRCSDAARTKKEIGLKSLRCADKKLVVRNGSLI